MPIKLMTYGNYNMFYKDENGLLHGFREISVITNLDYAETTTDYVQSFLTTDIYFSCDAKWTNKKLRKEMKHWLNCLSRRIRRGKRIKEQSRRAMLKWRALHND